MPNLVPVISKRIRVPTCAATTSELPTKVSTTTNRIRTLKWFEGFVLLLLVTTGCAKTYKPQTNNDRSAANLADPLIAEFQSVEDNITDEEFESWNERLCQFMDESSNPDDVIKMAAYLVAQSKRSMRFRVANDRAVRVLVERFPKYPETEFVVYDMHKAHTPDTMAQLNALVSAEHETLQVLATYALGCKLRKKDKPRAQQMLSQVAEYEKKLLVDRRGKIIDVRQQARQWLFEINQLQLGMVAPETTGIDLDGKEFRLSDYRGKVVLLSFWGDW